MEAGRVQLSEGSAVGTVFANGDGFDGHGCESGCGNAECGESESGEHQSD
jgi:hypothetical protein